MHVARYKQARHAPDVFLPLEYDPGRDAQIDWGGSICRHRRASPEGATVRDALVLFAPNRSSGFPHATAGKWLCCKDKADLLQWEEKSERGSLMSNHSPNPFKWRHFQADIILLCVRWYLRYALSYRDLEEIMAERGLQVDHTTIFRWVQRYAPELEQRCRLHLKSTTDSWRVDETYIKVKKEWVYLYRAVDSRGNTLDFFFSPTRDAQAAKAFLLKTLAASHTSKPRVINMDKNAAYQKAFQELKTEGRLPESCELRQVKYLNNLVEQNHRFIKRLTKPGMGFFTDLTAWRTLQGIEMMNMLRKGQVQGVDKGDVGGQVALVARLFGVAV
jgi:transposase-like protein